jgi:hypothetical protein
MRKADDPACDPGQTTRALVHALRRLDPTLPMVEL